jgi:hypothetical protein
MRKMIYTGLFFLLLSGELDAQFCFHDMKAIEGEAIEQLKLQEAEVLQIDTTRHFREEVQHFRAELLQSLKEDDPEFVRLSDEFRRGLLVFEITNKEVWIKSYTDTAGLRRFFEENRQCYLWEKPRFKGFIVHAKTKNDRKRLQQEIRNMPVDSASVYLRQAYIREDTVPVKISDRKIFTQGEDEYVDELIFHTGKGVPYLEFPRYFVVGELLDQPQDYTDVHAEVMDDYQKYLERLWIEQLRNKERNCLKSLSSGAQGGFP